MNTLGYVARQLDVLAAAKTPPTTDDAPGQDSIPRARSFLRSAPRIQPQRSHSTPSLHSPVPPVPPATAVDPSMPVGPAPAAPSPSRSKQHIEVVIDQIFFIRVFLVVWDHLKSAWSSLVDNLSLLTWQNAAAIDAISKGKAKETDADLVLESTIQLHALRSAASPLGPAAAAEPSLAPPSPAATASRSATPVLATRKSPFHLPKTLVLDLDETLIHSTSRPIPPQGGSGILSWGAFGQRKQGAGHMVEVVLGGRSTLYHVYKRPFVDFFLRTVSGWYTLVIFTASMQEYADPVIDWLDAGRGILGHRLFRDSCTQLPNGSYTKDLSVVEADLSRVCLVDNSPISYSVNEANGIPIEGWTHDPSDEALLDLLPVLDSLRFTSDVRRVLGLRTAGVHYPNS
ncbi:unnamed protein product [Cyclocybe aegerita]|uniref:FCP1 homology domain-containing protein n=1 Tax=Cyclocybe aegerita TaxID=1973307 RepID=A0A8S0XL11_CYCAE|nr:unnamed protein product [Cyclocybe aegerita]